MKKIFIITILSLLFSTAAAQQFAGPFNNYKIIQTQGLFGIIDNQNGDTILPCTYNYICSSLTYSQGVIIREDNRCFIFNPLNKKISPPKDVLPNNKYNLYALPIATNDKYGFVDGDGEIMIEGKWDFASDFSDSIARVVDNNGNDRHLSSLLASPSAGKTGYINRRGEYVIPLTFSYIDLFPSPSFRVTRFTRAKYKCNDDMGCENPYKTGKWGLINDKGEVVLQDTIYDFIDRGFVDEKSKELIFLVERNGKKGIINHNGKIVYPLASHISFEELWNKYQTDRRY